MLEPQFRKPEQFSTDVIVTGKTKPKATILRLVNYCMHVPHLKPKWVCMYKYKIGFDSEVLYY